MAEPSADQLDRVESRLRSVVALADAPPAQVTTLSKLAFEFRGTTLLEPIDAQLAGVRATLVEQGPMVFAGRTLRIIGANGGITGVIDGDLTGVALRLQTAVGADVVPVDALGAFRCETPQRPYRMTVMVDGTEFATAWQ